MSRPGQGARRRFAVAWVAVVVLAGCLWWGLHPPRTEAAYRDRSVGTVELLRSNVETTRIWLDAMDAGKVTEAAAEVALTETETDADRQVSSYAAYQPPNRSSRQLRADVTALGDRVVTLLGEIRVAAWAGRWDEAVAARDELAALSRRLSDLQLQVAP